MRLRMLRRLHIHHQVEIYGSGTFYYFAVLTFSHSPECLVGTATGGGEDTYTFNWYLVGGSGVSLLSRQLLLSQAIAHQLMW